MGSMQRESPVVSAPNTGSPRSSDVSQVAGASTSFDGKRDSPATRASSSGLASERAQSPLISPKSEGINQEEREEPAISMEVPRPDQYRLRIMQQPASAAAAGSEMQVLGRIPLTPSPVVELVVQDDSGRISPANYLQYFICFATLVDENQQPVQSSDSDEDLQVLIGQTVADLKMVTDLRGRRTAVFVFGDISIRPEGQFHVKFTLAQALPDSPTLASTLSNALTSVHADDFRIDPEQTGTALSLHLRNQGVSVYVGPIST